MYMEKIASLSAVVFGQQSKECRKKWRPSILFMEIRTIISVFLLKIGNPSTLQPFSMLKLLIWDCFMEKALIYIFQILQLIPINLCHHIYSVLTFVLNINYTVQQIWRNFIHFAQGGLILVAITPWSPNLISIFYHYIRFLKYMNLKINISSTYFLPKFSYISKNNFLVNCS